MPVPARPPERRARSPQPSDGDVEVTADAVTQPPFSKRVDVVQAAVKPVPSPSIETSVAESALAPGPPW